MQEGEVFPRFDVPGNILSGPGLLLEHGVRVGHLCGCGPSVGTQTNQPRESRFEEVQHVIHDRNRHEPPAATEEDLQDQGNQECEHRDLVVLLGVDALMLLRLIR